jgi:peptide/nickel transport system permease protein
VKGRLHRLLGFGLVGILLAVVAIGFVWLPYDPLAIDLDHTLMAPSLAHWLGTDEFGRDVAARAMLGARVSLIIAVETVSVAIVIGTMLGLLAGFLRGWTDRILMTFSDALLAFPGILLALALISVLGSSRHSIVLALAIAYLPATVRVVRAAALSIREREYIEASRVAGDGTLYTIWRHVLPNTIPQILVLATSLFGWVILSESALSFLGVGVPPPAPSWGNMLSSARPYMYAASWLSIAPGLCIVMTLLGINMLGDALRDRFDPRERA